MLNTKYPRDFSGNLQDFIGPFVYGIHVLPVFFKVFNQQPASEAVKHDVENLAMFA